MTVYYSDEQVTVHHGDCLDILKTLPDNSIDAAVTDPPYGLEFMGKEWDAPWKDAAAYIGRGGAHPNRNGEMPVLPQAYRAGLPFQLWCQQWATECLRVLKPGGHMLAFGGTRTAHRLASAIEDAGFEIRDSIAWLYASGFPKSLDISKAIDKARDDNPDRRAVGDWLRSQREARGLTQKAVAAHWPSATGGLTGCVANWELGFNLPTWDQWLQLKALLALPDAMDAEVWRLNGRKGLPGDAWEQRAVIGTRTTGIGTGRGQVAYISDSDNRDITAPATDAARTWQGWGTALKPAHEPIVVARKPIQGTVAANVLQHGTGGLNVDGCRVEGKPRTTHNDGNRQGTAPQPMSWGESTGHVVPGAAGRWPPNVVLDGDAAAELDKQSGYQKDGVATMRNHRDDTGGYGGKVGCVNYDQGYGGGGGASRYFPIFKYTPKAATTERPNYFRQSCECEEAWPTTSPVRATAAATLTENSSTSKCGSDATADQSPTATRSITSTSTNSTTTPTISSQSPQPTTNGCTPVANSATGSGLSPAVSAENSSRSTITTGISAAKDGPVTGVAGHATSPKWLKTSVCGECGAPARLESHATVKPIELIRWLIRLITPPGGTVLDCFAGSGTTGEAAIHEHKHAILIEREPAYLPLIVARLSKPMQTGFDFDGEVTA